MSWLPDPLHPAVVHFPIVLLLLGAGAAVVAVFWRGGQLPWFAAILLVLGALGAWVALETGEEDGGLLEKTHAQLESVIDAHIMWAKRTLAAAVLAAVGAVGAALLPGRKPRIARGVAVVTALAALVAAYTVYETGHRGGTLVFRHGAGVNLVGNQPAGSGTGTPVAEKDAKAKGERRD